MVDDVPRPRKVRNIFKKNINKNIVRRYFEFYFGDKNIEPNKKNINVIWSNLIKYGDNLEKAENDLINFNEQILKYINQNTEIKENQKNILDQVEEKLHTKRRKVIYDQTNDDFHVGVFYILKLILFITSITIIGLIIKKYK